MISKKIATLLLAALSLSSINAFSDQHALDQNRLSLINAKKGITSDFKDPGSATFRSVYIRKIYSKTDGMPIESVCGEVNGKNSYGAYVGYRRFFYSITGKSDGFVEREGNKEIFSVLFKMTCSTNTAEFNPGTRIEKFEVEDEFINNLK